MIHIRGNSGCILNIFHDYDNIVLIRKQTNDISYIERLQKQVFKQKQYNDFLVDFEGIRVPKVIAEKLEDNCFYFDMEFIQSLDAFRYLEIIQINKIDFFINKIIKLIDLEIKNSEVKQIDKKIFIDKLISIKNNILHIDDNYTIYFSAYVEQLINEIDNDYTQFELPIGYCHGDLTLSNMLVQNDEIVLIDFLDNFIETPLQDIVKLRQDIYHFWSFNMLVESYDIAKLKIILNYIDSKIDEYFKKYPFYLQYYQILQKINLLRIVPYSKNDKILSFLKHELQKLKGESKNG